MADRFRKLNDFNLSLRSKCTDAFAVEGKATAIKQKLKFWYANENINNLAIFLLLQNFFGGNNLKMDQFVKSDILRHS